MKLHSLRHRNSCRRRSASRSAARPQTPPPQSQQPTDISTTISGEPGTAPRFAVPPFIALSSDAETAAIARTIGDVLWDDLNFEREFAFIPRDVYATIPAAKSFDDVPVRSLARAERRRRRRRHRAEDRQRLSDSGAPVQRSQQAAGVRQGVQRIVEARLYAHTISDDIHQQQRALRGVARTKLTFDSDRDGERMTGTVESRGVKEIYTSDYDGENQRRVTTNRTLNINPAWSPDAPLARVHVLSARAAEHLHFAHLRGHAARR